MEDMCRIASFDIGKKNFAQYVEDFSLKQLQVLRTRYVNLPRNKQKKVKNTLSFECEEILNDMYLGGKRVQTGVYDLREDKTSNTLDLQTRKNIIGHLEKYMYLWETCNIIIIEQQYFRTSNPRGRGKGTEANVDAIKIAELVLGWFLINFMFKEIRYFPSQFKTQILGAPLKLSDKKRKEWASNKAEEIYILRGDHSASSLWKLARLIYKKRLTKEEKILEYISQFEGEDEDTKVIAEKIVRERQKLDDIGDACIQCQAYKFREIVAQL